MRNITNENIGYPRATEMEESGSVIWPIDIAANFKVHKSDLKVYISTNFYVLGQTYMCTYGTYGTYGIYGYTG